MDTATRKRLGDVKRLMEAAGTVGEAEAAAAAMQRLILKHNLTVEDLESLGKTEKDPYEALFIRVAPDRKPGIQWRLNLLYVLADYNFCVFIRYGVHGATGVIVGQLANQEAVRVMFEATVATVERLAETEWYSFRDRTQDWMKAGSPTAMAWKNSFQLGFAAGLRVKMHLERKHEVTEDNRVTALVLVKDEEIKEAVGKMVGTTTMHKGSRASNETGFHKGVEKGRTHNTQDRLEG